MIKGIDLSISQLKQINDWMDSVNHVLNLR